MLARLWSWFDGWVLSYEGDTRSCALIRVALVLIVWARLAGQLSLFRDPMHDPLMAGISVAFYGLTTLVLIGAWTRVSSALLGGLAFGIYLVGFYRPHEPWTHHHVFMLVMGLVLLATLPCGRSFSVDRYLEVRRAEREGRAPAPERAPVWGLRLFAIQMSTVYLFSAYDKCFWEFVNGERLQQVFAHHYFGSNPLPFPGFELFTTVLATGTLALEFLLPLALFVRRWQWWAVPTGLLLHGLFYWWLPVATFTVTVWVFYLGYLDADAVGRLLDRIQGRGPATVSLDDAVTPIE